MHVKSNTFVLYTTVTDYCIQFIVVQIVSHPEMLKFVLMLL